MYEDQRDTADTRHLSMTTQLRLATNRITILPETTRHLAVSLDRQHRLYVGKKIISRGVLMAKLALMLRTAPQRFNPKIPGPHFRQEDVDRVMHFLACRLAYYLDYAPVVFIPGYNIWHKHG